MTPCERLEAVFAGRKPDRTPILGGWITCPQHVADAAGVSVDDYWADPTGISIRAYRELGTDGLLGICVPARREDFRLVDANSYVHAQKGQSLEEAVAEVDAMPSAAQYERGFDFEKAYAAFRAEIVHMRNLCGQMLWMPPQWLAGAKASWYFDLGYENFFLIVGAYPDRGAKLMQLGGAMGFCLGRVIARAVEEGLYPKAILLGEDICTQRGPMISPEFISEHYAPALRHGLGPLLDVGCRPVWHSDGDIRQIMDMLIDCGVQGFQGFQPECGMSIDYVAAKRTRDGGPLLIFGPMAVTTELPVCAPKEVRDKVRHAIDVCRGRADLVMFTSNTINPDVPLANIRAMYEALRE